MRPSPRSSAILLLSVLASLSCAVGGDAPGKPSRSDDLDARLRRAEGVVVMKEDGKVEEVLWWEGPQPPTELPNCRKGIWLFARVEAAPGKDDPSAGEIESLPIPIEEREEVERCLGRLLARSPPDGDGKVVVQERWGKVWARQVKGTQVNRYVDFYNKLVICRDGTWSYADDAPREAGAAEKGKLEAGRREVLARWARKYRSFEVQDKGTYDRQYDKSAFRDSVESKLSFRGEGRVEATEEKRARISAYIQHLLRSIGHENPSSDAHRSLGR